MEATLLGSLDSPYFSTENVCFPNTCACYIIQIYSHTYEMKTTIRDVTWELSAPNGESIVSGDGYVNDDYGDYDFCLGCSLPPVFYYVAIIVGSMYLSFAVCFVVKRLGRRGMGISPQHYNSLIRGICYDG